MPPILRCPMLLYCIGDASSLTSQLDYLAVPYSHNRFCQCPARICQTCVQVHSNMIHTLKRLRCVMWDWSGPGLSLHYGMSSAVYGDTIIYNYYHVRLHENCISLHSCTERHLIEGSRNPGRGYTTPRSTYTTHNL